MAATTDQDDVCTTDEDEEQELDEQYVRDLEIGDEVSRSEMRDVIENENGFRHKHIRGYTVYSFNTQLVITEEGDSMRDDEEIIYNSSTELRQLRPLNSASFDSTIEKAIWSGIRRADQVGFEVIRIQSVEDGIEVFIENEFHDEVHVVELQH